MSNDGIVIVTLYLV